MAAADKGDTERLLEELTYTAVVNALLLDTTVIFGTGFFNCFVEAVAVVNCIID